MNGNDDPEDGEKGAAEDLPETDPPCPQCGSEDTAPIHREPLWVATDQSDPDLEEEPWYRCLTCRHKWKLGGAG